VNPKKCRSKKEAAEDPKTDADEHDSFRRKALFWLLAAPSAGLGALSTGLVVSRGVVDIWGDFDETRQGQMSRAGLIKDTFFNDLFGEVPLVPGFDQSVWKLEKELRPNDDIAALSSILGLYGRSKNFKITEADDAFAKNSGIICTGSPVTNVVARKVMPTISDAGRSVIRTVSGDFELSFVHLEGAKDSLLRRRLDRNWLEEPNHKIYDVDRNRYYSSFVDTKTREPNTGYLLFSKLPHVMFEDQTACVWAGNIGPATEALTLIFDDDQFIGTSQLEEIYDFASKNRFFQALFVVDDVERIAHRRHKPGAVRLVHDGLRPVRKL